MSREPWYESTNPSRVARGASWRVAAWTVGVMLFVGILAAGIWALKVTTSGVKGAGDATRIKNDGTNRVLSQQEFEQRYADIVAADKRIQVAYDQLATDRTDQVLRTRYVGAVQYCQGAVAEYNAAARTYTKAEFRAVDLPAQIDDTDPTTNCKEESTR